MSHPFVQECVSVLTRTPSSLNALLRDLPDVWIHATEGAGTWSPYTVIGHLNHCERADWMPRLEIILNEGTRRPFDPLDREAQFRESKGIPLARLLDDFDTLRRANLERVEALHLQDVDLDKQGMHPDLGIVSARQLLATWTAHDMGHVSQICRTFARRYQRDVGPWAQYMSLLRASAKTV